jgi:hypothetical protein
MGRGEQVLFILHTKETNMYLTTGDMIGITIALSSSIFIIVITTIANYQLQKDNKFIRTRLRVQREYCREQHVKVPF